MIRFLFIVFVMIACRDQTAKNLYDPQRTYSSTVPEGNKPPQGEDAKEAPKPGEEKLTPPVHISGTFLKCSAIDSNIEVLSDLGCALADATGNRVLPENLASEVDYLLPSVRDPSITVTVHKAEANEAVDVHYTFVGEDFLSVKNAIQEVELRVEFKTLLTGEPSGFVTGRGPMLLAEPMKPWWKRELASDSNGDGQCQAGETCRFESSEVMWLKDDGNIYGFQGAKSLCENYSDEYSDWRLPTENELHIAFAKQIMALNSNRFLNLRSARYWSGGDGGSGLKIALDLETGASLVRDPIDAFGALCVRTIHSGL